MCTLKNKICSEYINTINKYKTVNYIPTPQDKDWPIWVMWWQGENAMPEIVRICYASILKNSCGHRVNLITQSNYKDYISKLPRLPQLLECMRSGELTCTAFSDIVRCYLLYTFGGVWIDATILLADEIDNIITNNIFVSCRRLPIRRSIAKLKWSSFFVFSCRGNLIFKFMCEIFIKQITEKHSWPHYFFIDYCFIIAIDNLPFAENIQLKSPLFLDHVHDLAKNINNEVNEDYYNSLVFGNPFLKLTYKKRNFREFTKNGKVTYYGYIKTKFLSAD